MRISDPDLGSSITPVDYLEYMAALNKWAFERSSQDEIIMEADGRSCEYKVHFVWRKKKEILQVSCAYNFTPSKQHHHEILKLVSLINEQVCWGHFELLSEKEVIRFRYGLVLSGEAEFNQKQFEALLAGAVDMCELYYQTFQFVILTGRPASNALANALMDMVGSA